MIRHASPALLLVGMSLLILARRLDILSAQDASIWLLSGFAALVALLTDPKSQAAPAERPPADPARPGPGSDSSTGPGGTPGLADLREAPGRRPGDPGAH